MAHTWACFTSLERLELGFGACSESVVLPDRMSPNTIGSLSDVLRYHERVGCKRYLTQIFAKNLPECNLGAFGVYKNVVSKNFQSIFKACEFVKYRSLSMGKGAFREIFCASCGVDSGPGPEEGGLAR